MRTTEDMAREAGPLISTPFNEWCERFADLVRADERKQIALDKKAENARDLGLDYEPAPVQERNFCERCGKRVGGEGDIHTCTPPAEPVYVKTFHGGKPWPLHPEPVQEPVALVIDGVLVKSSLPEKYTGHLYTTPPAAQRQWVGLTDEERIEIRREHYARTLPLMDAVEAKLKEKNT